MNMQKLATCFVALAALSIGLNAAIIEKADNTEPFNSGASWVGGVVPGLNDTAYFPVDTPAASYVVGTQNWRGFYSDGNTGTYNLNNVVLTNGSLGMIAIYNRNHNWSGTITLASSQIWDYRGGSTIGFTGTIDLNGHDLLLIGNSTKQPKGAIIGGGTITIDEAGSLKMSNGTTAPTVDIHVKGGRSINFDNGGASGHRAKNIHMHGGTIHAEGRNSSGTAVDTIAEAMILKGGLSTINVNPRGYNARIQAEELRQMGGAAALVRGHNLGFVALDTPISSGRTDANIVFATPPAMIGGAGGSGATTMPIIPFLVGATNTSDAGFSLVTYDNNFGIRVLDTTTDFAATFADGHAQLDNVRLDNASGAPEVITLTQPTTVNSLSLISSAASSGFEITGDTTLTLNSGVLFNRHYFTASGKHDAGRAVISPTFLDLNENEGIFYYNLIGAGNSGLEGAPLTFATCVTNDAGKGATFVGLNNSTVRLASSVHGYTGPTRLASGYLWLNSPIDNTGVPGDVVISGGTLINPGNQIPDSADITVNAGTYNQRLSNSTGSGASENFRDLFMYGGTYTGGAGGTHNGRTIMRSATLAGGTWNVSKSHRATITNDLVLSGGVIALAESADVVGGNNIHPGGILYVEGTTTISNTPIIGASAYTPVRLSRSTESAFISHINLYDDLFFYGNDLNDDPVAFVDAGTLALPGEVRLNGTRTFQINDGAADEDLIIEVSLADFISEKSITTPGGLIKTGAGTLSLSGAANTHTLGAEIREGTLAASGEFASAITVGNNAAFNPRGAIINDTLTLADGATLRFDLTKETPDFLTVNGAIINQGTTHVDVTFDETADSEEEDYLLAAAATIAGGNFTHALPPKWHVYTARNNTELRVGKVKNTIIIIR